MSQYDPEILSAIMETAEDHGLRRNMVSLAVPLVAWYMQTNECSSHTAWDAIKRRNPKWFRAVNREDPFVVPTIGLLSQTKVPDSYIYGAADARMTGQWPADNGLASGRLEPLQRRKPRKRGPKWPELAEAPTEAVVAPPLVEIEPRPRATINIRPQLAHLYDEQPLSAHIAAVLQAYAAICDASESNLGDSDIDAIVTATRGLALAKAQTLGRWKSAAVRMLREAGREDIAATLEEYGLEQVAGTEAACRRRLAESRNGR